MLVCVTTRSANMHTDRLRDCPTVNTGTFTQALFDEAKNHGWTVISTKDDWRQIFAFEQ